MKNNQNKSSGIITVMVSLLLIPLLSFGTLIMEMGRFVSARQTLADAQITASMSVLANFNTYLFDRFGILAIDPDGTQAETYSSMLRYNSDAEGGNTSKLYNLDSNIKYESIYNLSDYDVLKRQILEYAKYSVPYEILSNKLDLGSLFDPITNLADKAKDFINNLIDETDESVTTLDKAFYSIGRAEYRAFEINTYFGQDYSKKDYAHDDILSDYIRDSDTSDGNGAIPNNGTPPDYSKLTGYEGRYAAYVKAIDDKRDFLANNPDPKPTYDKAVAIKVGSTGTVSKDDLYKAAVMKFLENDNNKPTEDNPDGASINGRYSLSPTKYTFSVTPGYRDDAYNLKTGEVSIPEKSGTSNETVYLTDAIDALWPNSPAPTNYYELEYYADVSGYDSTSSDSYISSYNSDLKTKGKAIAKQSLVSKLNQECINYNNALAGHNSSINSKAVEYVTDLQKAKSLFEDYAAALEIAAGAGENGKGTIHTAKDEYKDNVDLEGKDSSGKQVSDAESLGSNSSEVEKNLDAVISDFKSKATAARSTAAFLGTLISNVSTTDGSKITYRSHNSDTGIDTVNGGIQVGISNDKLKGRVSRDFTLIDTLYNTEVIKVDESSTEGDENKSNCDELSDIVGDSGSQLDIGNLWKAAKKVLEILNPVPSPYDSSYCMTLSEHSIGKLIKELDQAEGRYNAGDKSYVDNLTGKVTSDAELGEFYDSIVGADNELLGSGSSDFQSKTESLFGEEGKTEGIYNEADENKSTGLGKLIKKIKKLIQTIREAVEAITGLISSIASVVADIVTQTYHALLINTYITQKFPSRMNSAIEGATLVPPDTESLDGESYFSSCCIEYCLWGDNSEKNNQIKTFWLLFGIRAVVNCVQILMDSQAMSLVSSCNLFAPLMFIAMLYLETNIDMNYLVVIGEKVPFWKKDIHLSAEGLAKILSEIGDFDSTKVWVASSGNGKRYHKDETCHMIQINPNGVGLTKKTISEAVNENYTPCKVCNPKTESEPSEDDKKNGYVPLDYDQYLYILLLFVGMNKKLTNVANLMQLETRYYESKKNSGTATFMIKDASTYIRSEVKASYKTMLPMFSLGSSGNSFPELYGLEYVGY